MVSRFLDPQVDSLLLLEEGEFVVDEVRKHWVAVAPRAALMVAAAPVFLLMVPAGPWFWFPLLLGLFLFVHGLFGVHAQHMDRFVITNMRVFRVHGVFSQQIATMPIVRILDISVSQPLIGRLLGYGHFVFESAAQDQGLRDIRFVGDPLRRDHIIQRVIQRAGLRATASDLTPDDFDAGV